MPGTAFPAARVLLVEQPGPWGSGGLTESLFDPVLARRLVARAQGEGYRVLAVRRPGRTPSGIRRRVALVDTREGSAAIRWGAFDADAELLDIPLDGSFGEPDPAPLYLVCAHSKHDACCAIRGRPVAAAFEQERPGRVWESSHLGGDRFAANVLVLPGGWMYGRVLPFAAPEFIAAVETGEVVPALLRGRIGHPQAVQAAVVFAFEQLALRRADALRVLGATAVEAETCVDLDAPHGRVRVLVRTEKVAAEQLTCVDARPGTFLAYRPLRIEQL